MPYVREKIISAAHTSYRANIDTCRALLDEIRDELVSHEQASSNDPTWGQVGDLQHVAVLLREINSFIKRGN